MANNYPVLRKRFAFAAGVEGTPGTPETLSWSANAIRLLGISVPEVGYLSPNTRSDANTGTLGTPSSAPPSGKFYSSRVRFALVGAGSAYAYTSEAVNTLPECHPLLRAAGYALAVSGAAGSEKATYSFSDDPVTAITAYVMIAGKKYVFTYAVLEGLTITETAGTFAVAEGNLIGIASSEAEADLSTPTYDSFTTAPYPSMKGSGSLVVGSYEPQFQSIVVNTGTTAQPNNSGNATDGHAGYRITSRTPTAVLQARVANTSNWDPRADVDARTSRTIDTVCGSVQYKRVKLDIDAAVAQIAQLVEDGEYMNYTVTYEINPATAECSVVFD